MNNPRVVAIVSGFAAVLAGYNIFSASQTPSQGLAILQWVIFGAAVIACVGSLIQLARK